jgi:prolyl-tRNA synthetase
MRRKHITEWSRAVLIRRLLLLLLLLVRRLNASRVTLPTLISRSLMEKTSRWDRVGTELMKLRVSNRDYCLAPTHEEVATVVAADALVSPRSFPIRMYQIEKKFRDEARPRDGLMRSR